MFKKILKKIPTSVVVFISILALLVLFIFYYSEANDDYPLKQEKEIIEVSDVIFNTDDPFTTRVNDLEDRLTGPLITKRDPSAGIISAPITIVEFSDFSCDFCNKQEQVLKKIMQKYENKIRLIWKDFPEFDKDSESYQASIAGRCAQQQDNFWIYHDFLYDFNDRLNRDTFIEIAEILKMDIETFKKCLDDSIEVEKLIKENIDEANALQISGIPFIYINEQENMGEITYEDLERIVELELK